MRPDRLSAPGKKWDSEPLRPSLGATLLLILTVWGADFKPKMALDRAPNWLVLIPFRAMGWVW